MKKYLTFLLVIFLNINYICKAQAPDGVRNRAETAHVAYINKELALTGDEASKFWPLYNQYARELKSVRRENRNDQIEMEERVLNTRKKYKEDFKRVLGSDERVNQLFIAERNFKEMLRRELIKRRLNSGAPS